MEVLQKKAASQNAHQGEKSWEKKRTQSLTRSSAVFFTFQRGGGQGDKKKECIVKIDKGKAKEKGKKWRTNGS